MRAPPPPIDADGPAAVARLLADASVQMRAPPPPEDDAAPAAVV